ncbi:MAG: cell division protein FtsQ/DivIB [Streptosporangiaceae bacterium]
MKPSQDPADSGRARRGLVSWRTALFGVLALAVMGGAAWALLGSSLLVVRHVEVTGNRLVSTAEIRAAAKIRPGAPLATVNTAAAAHRVEQLAPVLSAQVSRSWPDTIVITVTERTPEVAVASAGGYQLIDGDGVRVRFVTRKPVGMPVLTAPPAVLRGNSAVRAAVMVLTRLPPKLRSLVVSVSAPAASAVTLRLAGGIRVMWGGAGNARQKAADLAVLLRTHGRYFDVSDPNAVVTER